MAIGAALLCGITSAQAETYLGYFPCWVAPSEICAPIGRTITVGNLSGNGYFFYWESGITDAQCRAYQQWAHLAGPGGLCF
jgi:hypothetical protein